MTNDEIVVREIPPGSFRVTLNGRFICNFPHQITADIIADSIRTALRARIPADDGDDKQLRRLLAWCRPRLSRDSYRDTLDKMLVSPPEPDHTPMVQSAGEQRLRVALRETLEQAEGCWMNHYGDNPEGSPAPQHIAIARAALTREPGDGE